MAKTRANLAQRALEKLMVVGAGQSADSEDMEKADDVIDAMVADLAARDVYSVADLDDIDLAAFEWLADYLAFLIAPDFALPQDEGRRQRAEFMLRRQNAAGPTYEVLKAEYF